MNIIYMSHLLEITFSITINQENLQCDVSSLLTSYHLPPIVMPLSLVKLRHTWSNHVYLVVGNCESDFVK